nr:type IV pilin protein [uncultured Halomonas sp.]
MNTQHRNQGFTLIELMIVVAIVGVLASIAYPSYHSYVERSRRGDATTGLLSLAQAQERFMSRCGEYASRLEGSSDCSDTDPGLGLSDALSEEGFYAFSMNATLASYTLTATPRGSQASDEQCQRITLNHLGIRTAQNDKGESTRDTCW